MAGFNTLQEDEVGAETFLGLSDVPSSYTGQANKSVTVKADETGLEFTANVATDEKVKYDVSDPTAGYVADKIVAGTGISVAEGTGGNENKLVVTNTIDTLSEVSNTPTDPFVSTTGQTVVDEIGAIFTVEHEPTGMSDNAESTIAFDNGTRTFTITPVGANFNYYISGKKYTKTIAQTVVIPDTEGIHFIYFDGATLTSSTTGSEALLTAYAYVANVYWDATNNLSLVFGEERHGLIMDNKTHSYLHNTKGTGLQSGGALGDITVDQDGSLAAHAQFSNAATVIWDEDISHTLTARGSTENIGVYYRTGADASNIWRLDATASFGVLTTGTGRAAYNQNNAGTWQLTEVGDGNFVLAHVFAFNDTTRKFGVIMGQATYTTIPSARDGATTEINSITLAGLPSQEFKFLGTIIYQTNDTYTNAVKSRIRATDTSSTPYVDLRSQTFPAAGSISSISNHASLSNLAWGSSGHTGTASNVAGFDGTGAATNYAIDTDLSSVSASDDTVPSAKATKTYADSKVADAINDGTTTIAPSQNAVFDALALKAPLTSPTFQTSINGSYLTASEILGTDGSKNIVSLPVATYPSLTELSYIKGVTSAIQTQLGTKVTSGGALGTPSSGTLTNCSGLPVSGITASTSTALGVGSVELGHASDTTIARVSAGVISVEGVTVPTISSTSTLTNKRITRRVTTTTDDATAVIDIDTCDEYQLSAVANATEFTTTGTPTDGQTLVVRIKDAGVAKALTWTGFTAIGVTLPTTTTAGKWTYVGFKYNLAATAWHALAVTTEA